MAKTIEKQLGSLTAKITKLLKVLKPEIMDDYRASDDYEDKTPGMCVTIGFTPASEDKDLSWDYQTGDNSYTGGAYGHPHWAVISLYRTSNCTALAVEAVEQLAELCVE